jgi:hypothetical protein
MLKRTFILRAIGASIGLWLSIVSVRAFADGAWVAQRATSQVTFRR